MKSEATPSAVDFRLEAAQLPRAALLRVKRTYRIGASELQPMPPLPLFHDVDDPSLRPRWRPGSDFWPPKSLTDVVVVGHAYAPGGAARTARVSVHAAGTDKTVAVFGPRVASLVRGRVRFSDPAPFSRQALTYRFAYGGWDQRVQVSGAREWGELLALTIGADHPGMYPRNPFGMGYVVGTFPASQEVALPHLEDPTELLTPEGLVVPEAAAWFTMPLPWCFHWTHPRMFPRTLLLDSHADAWHPSPDDERLPEVRRGYLRPSARSRSGPGADPSFHQEASHGLAIAPPSPGARFVVRGMTEAGAPLELDLPPGPRLEVRSETGRHEVAPSLQSILIEPDERRVSFTYLHRQPLGRVFLPGVHPRVPVAISIDGAPPVEIEMPATLDAEMGGLRPIGAVAPPRGGRHRGVGATTPETDRSSSAK